MKRLIILCIVAFVGLIVVPAGQADPPEQNPSKPFEEILEAITNLQNEVENLPTYTSQFEEILESITSLQNKVDSLPTYTSQYVPFTETISPHADGYVCAGPGLGSPATKELTINSDNPFIVTTIQIRTIGVDEYKDVVKVWSITVDDGYFPTGSPDLTQNGGFPIYDTAFDVLGGLDKYESSLTAGKFPQQLASNGNPGVDDIIVAIACDAGDTKDLSFYTITVGGWKRQGSDVSVTFPY